MARYATGTAPGAFASESQHWYTLDGEPMYEIVGKNGNVRPTTLRDARKLNLVPSVTSIIRAAAAPGLERWKNEQVLLAALTLPRVDGEPDKDFCARVMRDSQEQGRKAADRGTEIHEAIERHFRGESFNAEFHKHVAAAREAIMGACGTQKWGAERSFAHHLGYGGKSDLWSSEWVLDTKTKEFSDAADVAIWDDHLMQLSAYRRGLGVPCARCGILFVSRNIPGLATLITVGEEELARGLTMFDALLAFWQAKTGHRPMVEA